MKFIFDLQRFANITVEGGNLVIDSALVSQLTSANSTLVDGADNYGTINLSSSKITLTAGTAKLNSVTISVTNDVSTNISNVPFNVTAGKGANFSVTTAPAASAPNPFD